MEKMIFIQHPVNRVIKIMPAFCLSSFNLFEVPTTNEYAKVVDLFEYTYTQSFGMAPVADWVVFFSLKPRQRFELQCLKANG